MVFHGNAVLKNIDMCRIHGSGSSLVHNKIRTEYGVTKTKTHGQVGFKAEIYACRELNSKNILVFVLIRFSAGHVTEGCG